MSASARRTALALFLLALAFAAGYLVAGRRGPGPAPTPAASPPIPLRIATEAPERRSFPTTIPWQGTVVSSQSVQVTALEAGRVTAVKARDQETVQKGDLLFTLGGAQLAGKLAAQRQKLASLRRQQELAAQTLKRKQEAAAEKIVTLDALASAQDQAAALQSEVEAATTDLAALERGTQVRAPAAGIFTGRSVVPGQEVAAGTPLAEIVDPARLRIVATLFPPEGAKLAGKTAQIEAGEGEALTGTVAGVLPARTTEGGTQVWIEGEEIARRLRPGETVGGTLLLQTEQEALAVPRAALVYGEEEKPLVFVATPKGYQAQPVRTGRESDGWVEIPQGLTGNEQVVVRGAYELYYRDFSRTYREPD